jgi:alkylation response protein AidB-like acyl-CoA dehydrogenase
MMSTTTLTDQPTPPHQEFVARARELASGFAERAADAERLRRLPEESVAEMVQAGFPRILAPREYGGYELGAVTWFEVVREIARADASHGWCASLMIHHAHYVSLFPAEARQAVWENGPDTVVAASIIPSSTVTAVDGGYRISGRAGFTSGITGSSWVIVGGLLHSGGAPPEWMWFLIAPDQYVVEDTWFTSGMCGTGSNTVVTDDVFVPRSRAVAQDAVREATAPGSSQHHGAFYRAPWSMYAPLTFAAPMLGAAQGAYRRFVESTTGRRVETGQSIGDLDHVQVKVGRVGAVLDCADSLLARAAATIDSGQTDNALRARAVRDYSFAAELCIQAIDQTVALNGSAGFAESNPAQRAWRDVHFASAHRALIPELNYAYYGQRELRVEPDRLPY